MHRARVGVLGEAPGFSGTFFAQKGALEVLAQSRGGEHQFDIKINLGLSHSPASLKKLGRNLLKMHWAV